MKLQKLLKKLALPVFALAVVGMLAACSSPSGGGSGSNTNNGNGDKDKTGIEGEAGEHKDNKDGKEASQSGTSGIYEVYYDGDLVMELPAAKLEAFSIDAGLTSSDYEVHHDTKKIHVKSSGMTKIKSKETALAAQYGEYFVDDEEDGSKDPKETQQGGDISGLDKDATYTVKSVYNGQVVASTPTPGTQVALVLANLPQGATYTIEGTTITLDLTNANMSSGGQPTIPVGDEEEDDELDPEQIPASWYKIYYGNNMVDAMSASALDGFAYAVGLVENTDYTIDHTAKKITLTASGYQKAIAYKSNH